MERRPQVVELIGPAGAGKTTLARSLSQCGDKILVAVPPPVREVGSIPFFARNAVLLLPTLHRLQRNGRSFSGSELAMMMYLKGWHRLLRRQVSDSDLVVILDHGPIFMLALLYGFGPDCLKSQKAEEWWASMFKQWAAATDLVIWLDASDVILMQRINARNRAHVVKGKSAEEVCAFLARWRTSYEEIMANLMANRKVALLRLDTGQETPDQTADKILPEFGLRFSES